MTLLNASDTDAVIPPGHVPGAFHAFPLPLPLPFTFHSLPLSDEKIGSHGDFIEVPAACLSIALMWSRHSAMSQALSIPVTENSHASH